MNGPCDLTGRRLDASDIGLWRDAEGSGTVVADQPAREADQDRRQGRQAWRLRHLPIGRGRGVAADVRRNPVADRPTAGPARASMSGVKAGCDR
jgi:hypothetical protein